MREEGYANADGCVWDGMRITIDASFARTTVRRRSTKCLNSIHQALPLPSIPSILMGRTLHIRAVTQIMIKLARLRSRRLPFASPATPLGSGQRPTGVS